MSSREQNWERSRLCSLILVYVYIKTQMAECYWSEESFLPFVCHHWRYTLQGQRKKSSGQAHPVQYLNNMSQIDRTRAQPQVNLRFLLSIASNSLKFQPCLSFFLTSSCVVCIFFNPLLTQLVFTIFLSTKLFAKNRRMQNESFTTVEAIKGSYLGFCEFFCITEKYFKVLH